MSQHIIKAGAVIAVGGVTVGGTVLSIPLTPVYVVAGIIGGTIILNSYINNSKGNKRRLLIANQKQMGDEELFTMEERGDSFVAFKANNGKYVSRKEENDKSLKATAASVGKSELFKIVIKEDQIAMKDPIVILKPIKIEKTFEFKIDILNHEQLTKDRIEKFTGETLAKTISKAAHWAAPKQMEKLIKSSAEEEFKKELANIEEQIVDELPAKIIERIQEKLKKKNVKAIVTISVK